MSIDATLKSIIAGQLGIPEEQIQTTSGFVEDLGADSLDMVELIMHIEESFDVQILDEDVENIKTVADAAAYIQQHTS